MGYLKQFIILFLIVSSYLLFGEKVEFNIYIDADFTSSIESSESIKKGIETALYSYLPEEIKINIITKDHRGNSRRSLKHLKEFLADDKALLVFSGLHSPPLLTNLNFINNNSILLLDPWAAATPITRSSDKSGRNWVFRLSIDDSQAGEVIVAYSLDSEKFKKPILVLEDTGWGRANEKTLKNAIKSRGLDEPPVLWFDWKVGDLGIKQMVADVISHRSDVIFLVANSSEGSKILEEITKLDETIPVRSHWGITGGNTYNVIKKTLKSSKLDLKFIQTSFLFTNENLQSYQKSVWEVLSQNYPSIQVSKDLKAPVGFIHSYDLTKIFIEALKNVDLSNDIKTIREDLRLKLENLDTKIIGLIKEYDKPFSSYDSNNFFSHEALRINDFKMAKYNSEGDIELVE